MYLEQTWLFLSLLGQHRGSFATYYPPEPGMNLPHFPSIPYCIFCQELRKVRIVGKGRTKADATMTARGSAPRDFPLYNFLKADKVQQNKTKKLGEKSQFVQSGPCTVQVCETWSGE